MVGAFYACLFSSFSLKNAGCMKLDPNGNSWHLDSSPSIHSSRLHKFLKMVENTFFSPCPYALKSNYSVCHLQFVNFVALHLFRMSPTLKVKLMVFKPLRLDKFHLVYFYPPCLFAFTTGLQALWVMESTVNTVDYYHHNYHYHNF